MKRSVVRKRLYVSSLAVALLIQMAAAVPNFYTFNSPRNKTDELFVIGGILPIHKTSNGSCGHIDGASVQYVEAVSYVIQRINSQQASVNLSEVKLSFEIYDSCGTISIALQQTLRLLTPKNGNGVSAVIGEKVSSVTISVANLLQLFHVPLISIASTTPSLSDKTQYGYFARTCPSDSYQTRALADIVNHFNWSYVVAINSGDIYGQAGIKGFQYNFQNVTLNRCVAGDSIEIPYPRAAASDYDAAVSKLAAPYVSNATVIVLFAQPATVEGLLDAVQRRRERDHTFAAKQFLWVGSAAWTTSLDSKRYEIARNVIGVIPEAVNTTGFDEYFQRLHISNHTDNPWFAEYWEDYFKCSLNGTNPALPICNVSNQRISRTNGYVSNVNVPNCIDAVYAIAHAVGQIQQSVCNGSGLCNATRSSETNDVSAVDGNLLFPNILKVNFTSESGNDFSFDSNGDPTNTIFTVQYVHNGQINTLGKWDNSKFPSLQLNYESIFWNETNPPPKSLCSEPCAYGQFQEAIQGQSGCCWNCKNCRGINYYSDRKVCMYCAEGLETNLNMDGCVPIHATYYSASNAWAITSIVIAGVGFAIEGTSIAIFVIHFNNRIIRAASRELTAVLLIGIFFCYLVPFIYIIKPSLIICGVRRFAVGFGFSSCFSPVLVRTVRIHRIFNREASATSLRYVNPLSQVTFAAVLISIQVVISSVWLGMEPPTVRQEFDAHSALIECGENPYVGLSVTLVYNAILLLITLYFAFRTRKVPDNFNEAKFINLTTYSLLIIWIAFIPIYYGTLSLGPTFQSSSLIMGTVLSASVILGCLVVPKMYVIIRTEFTKNQERGTSNVTGKSAFKMDDASIRKETSIGINPLKHTSVDRAMQQESHLCHAGTQTYN